MLCYLLDTNICIYVVNRRPPEIAHMFNRNNGQMAISAITLAELLHGAEKSRRREVNLRVVEDFASRLETLSYGTNEAMQYSIIRADLERQGTPIGVNDLHIAAHAIASGLTLVTNNEKEFKRVSGLRIENWAVGS